MVLVIDRVQLSVSS